MCAESWTQQREIEKFVTYECLKEKRLNKMRIPLSCWDVWIGSVMESNSGCQLEV